MHFKDMKWYMKALMGFLVLLLSPFLLLAIICGFVFVNILASHLQEHILPLAQVNLDSYDVD